MPRQPRIDAPGVLYHIIARGIERREIFKDDRDRKLFLSRMGEILKDSATPIYAFALMPNHFHLLLRRVETPIATVMRKLLTGYAVNFNKRHHRAGHLFQNRYKSIICQEEPYLLELIRYIHLNPMRSGVVKTLEELEKYRFSGHSYILGENKSEWFEPDAILNHFGSTKRKALDAYISFVNDGIKMGKRPDLTGGGLKRSLGYPKHYPKTKIFYDDRILGEGSFVQKLVETTKKEPDHEEKSTDIDDLFTSICREYDITKAELLGDTKEIKIANARAILACRMSKELGLSGSGIARELAVTQSAVFKMIRRGKLLR